MKIIADENIPYVGEAFATLGNVSVVPGRRIDANMVRDAEVLVVRSVTGVGEKLLNDSSVRFVGTVTIGTDHIDLPYLQEQGIGFSSAPGSNANSVAEYVVAVLLFLGKRLGFCLKGKTLGIIGAGNIGSRVAKKTAALGMEVLLNDPPLERRTSDPKYLPLEALMDADILTLHVPLTRAGKDATEHIVNEKFLKRMKKDAILINTSRGAVVETETLKMALRQNWILGAALDVWEDEPRIDMELLKAVTPGTPHIAGYSLDGKINGTLMVYEAACKHLDIPARWNGPKDLPVPEFPSIVIEPLVQKKFAAGTLTFSHQRKGKNREIAFSPAKTDKRQEKRGERRIDREVETTVAWLVYQVYNIQGDDADLKMMFGLSYEQRGRYFDRLRKEYPVRREFFNTTVKLPDGAGELKRILGGIGFRT